jgi:hypothetical protein
MKLKTDPTKTYVLAQMAGCGFPDSTDSAGAHWLRRVANDVQDFLDENLLDESAWSDIQAWSDVQDDIHELADACVPIYTGNRWAIFADLAAYEEDLDDWGTQDSLTDSAGLALYLIARRLIEALVSEAFEDEDEPDA